MKFQKINLDMEKPESCLCKSFIFVKISKNLEINDFLKSQKHFVPHFLRCGTP